MREITGDMWTIASETIFDAICCTTNMVVKANGDLVMGKGVAKQFANRFPDLQQRWGTQTNIILSGKLKSNVIVTPQIYKSIHLNLVSFPTKYHWREKSSIDLIRRSAIQLYTISQALGWAKILLPRPGCSNGGLDWESQVRPTLIKVLDERFWIINDR